jgi:tetratricopeptide (TPR) repeat protein
MGQAPGLEAIVAKIRAGEDAGALGRLDQFLEKHPGNASARYWRGLVLYRLGRLEEAVGSLSACLALGADNPDALEARASCHWARKEWKEAAADWEAVIAISSRSRGRLEPYLAKAREAAR